MTVAEVVRAARQRLAAVGIDSAEAEASTLLEALLGVSRADLWLRRTDTLAEAQSQTLEAWLRRREAREPLQHILGQAHFYGLTLRVTPDTLIPRPETESLVALGLQGLRGLTRPRVLDVGTGSGAVALALKAERPDALVCATDISPRALAVAADNAQRLGLELEVELSDLLGAPAVQAFARRVDLLVANLPYLPESDAAWLSPEVQRDPPEALFSGPDGLAHFRRLMAQAYALLRPGAVSLFELDPRNVEAARQACALWPQATLHGDLAGRVRFLRVVR